MSKFRKRIDKLKKLQLTLQRKMYPFFHSTHPLFRKKDYFLKLFKEKAQIVYAKNAAGVGGMEMINKILSHGSN